MQIELPNKITYLSDEHKQFIRDNWGLLPADDIRRAINSERPAVRSISLTRVYVEAKRLGVFKSNSKRLLRPERKMLDKLTLKDKYFVKREYKQGTSIDNMLTIINAAKDIKVTSDELSDFIENEVKNTLTGHSSSLNFTIEEDILIINLAKSMSFYRISLHLNKNRSVKMSFNSVKRRYERLMKLYQQIKPLIPHIENNL